MNYKFINLLVFLFVHIILIASVNPAFGQENYHAQDAVVEPLEVRFPDTVENPFFHKIGGIAPTPTGWAVLDTGNHRVVHINQQGNVLGIYGCEGEGPGEFVNPTQIRTRTSRTTEGQAPPADIWVLDNDARRITGLHADATPTSITIPTYVDSFCLQDNQIVASSNPFNGGLFDLYNFDGTVEETEIGPVDTVAVEGYRGPVSLAVRAENKVYIECLNDEYILAAYENRPLVRKISTNGTIMDEWRLEGGILSAVAERRDEWIARNLEESGGQAYPTVPIVKSTTLLDDGSLLIALTSGQFHRLNPSTGEQSWYTYQDVRNLRDDEEMMYLHYISPSKEDGLLTADPRHALLYTTTLQGNQ
ncbi:MAG: hypothetical protein PPP56_06810 [Longimonas sp.]|uniref:hypothetical protein n=1 Tax=Longimonas sp. TaxID=2039626 RepID=UPI003344FEA4